MWPVLCLYFDEQLLWQICSTCARNSPTFWNHRQLYRCATYRRIVCNPFRNAVLDWADGAHTATVMILHGLSNTSHEMYTRLGDEIRRLNGLEHVRWVFLQAYVNISQLLCALILIVGTVHLWKWPTMEETWSQQRGTMCKTTISPNEWGRSTHESFICPVTSYYREGSAFPSFSL